jgi:hypothetical protein
VTTFAQASLIEVVTILDRLMHSAHLLEFEGISYRLKEAASRLTGLVKQSATNVEATGVD